MHELADLTALEMSRGFAAGTLSPVETIRAVLARVDRLEPLVMATYASDPAGALRDAAAAQARWRAGAPLSPIDGVPVTLKELIATQGVPKPMGTAAVELVPQPADAPIAARLREAGAVIFAKTTVPDYGMLSSGLSSFHLLTRNPWDLTRNPGGSSAGAGAAAAAGYGPLHVGTDIGGSVRLPAGWCGVFGFKPSHGRVPLDPTYIGRVAGPMTRTVADSALLMEFLARPDLRDFMNLPAADLPWHDLAGDVQGLRIGVMLDAGCGTPTDPDVAAAITAAAGLFAQGGAIVEPMAPFMTPELLDGFDIFFRTRFWAETKDLPPERYDRILPFIRSWVEGAEAYSGLDVYRGFDRLMAIREIGVRASLAYDYVLSPVSPMAAYAAELPSPNNDPARPFDHIAFTMPINMTEQPASAINCGYTAGGLPIGLQIAGRRHDDIGVLRVSHWFEGARGPQRAWPLATVDVTTGLDA